MCALSLACHLLQGWYNRHVTTNCYHHPYPAIAVCETCRRPLCSVCVRWERGYAFCEHDLPTALPAPSNEAITPGEDRTSLIVNYYGPMQTAAAPPESALPPTAPESPAEESISDEVRKYLRAMGWYEKPLAKEKTSA